jgi:acetyl esterase
VSTDSEVSALIDLLAAERRPSSVDLPLPLGRRNFEEFVRSLSARDEDVAVEDRVIPGPAGPLRLRTYRSRSCPPGARPAVVFFHGGGWVFGSLESHDGLCRSLAAESQALVVAVDYRLAPEHPFPAALEDCLAATAWVAGHGELIGARNDALALAGDSAGATLALGVALHARDRGGPRIALQLLFYPPTNAAANGDSPDGSSAFFLTRAEMDWYWARYFGSDDARLDPYAAPALAPTLTGLPRAYVVAAGDDPLRRETVELASRLAAGDVPVTLRVYDTMVHGFVLFTRYLSTARFALRDAGHALAEALDAR